MPKYFDDAGNEVKDPLLTQAEVDAAKTAAIEEYKKQQTDEAAAAKAKADSDAAAAAAAATADENDPGKKALAEVARINATLLEERKGSLATKHAGDDVEKRAAFLTKFDRLTGYADTPEGMAERGADAATLAFGTKPAVNVAAVAGTNGGRNLDVSTTEPLTDSQKVLAKQLNLTDEDVKKAGVTEPTK